MARETIPRLKYPKAFNERSLIMEAAKAHFACTKSGGMEYDWDKYNKQPLPIRTAWTFGGWLRDLNNIADNLNIVTDDLAGLANRADLPGSELWTRYRLLVRTTLNEFYRVKEVSELFYKELKKLDLITEADRHGLSQMMRDLLGKLIDARNHVTHVGMHVLEEERRAFVTVMAEELGGAIVSKTTGEKFQPSFEIGEIATKISSEFATIGRELFAYIQDLSDESAKWIADNRF